MQQNLLFMHLSHHDWTMQTASYMVLPHAQLNRLQKIQNFAARVISKTLRFDHISPVLKDLHWLPVSKRIEFKSWSTHSTLFIKLLHPT